MVKKGRFLLLCAPLLLGACATVSTVDPNAFVRDPGEKLNIPAICKKSYDNAIPKVAVAQITNNSTFDYAKTVQASVQGRSERTTVGAAGVVAVPGAVGVGWGEKEKRNFQRDSQRTEREINAKLSESVEDGVVNELVNMGGVKIFTRGELNKIMQEHKFQQSGLVDDSSIVQLGKMAGAKFMLTGSLTNVALAYQTLDAAKDASQKYLGGFGALMAVGMESREGWHIDVDVTLRLLDVETGEVLLSKSMKGKEIIGKIPYPNYDALVGGIKKASAKALQDARPDFSKYFMVRGYVFETRTSKDGAQKIGLVSVGSKLGIKPGSKFTAIAFEEIEDPINGSKVCDQQRIPLEVTATDQVQNDRAWVVIKGTPDQLARIKKGQLVERESIEGQGLMNKLGY
ncbi:CsgG/HfaB family protein [Geomesophilobacter sediminis]|uniref:Curli production assembly/transport component CsgG n=1 Tax=Geomesophilobacter sediminis TaxID=2798584 RepID=A0A8J7JDS2_9BACT|nr:CsgG/HfaB family protein [Geomesophilobacter sediminis]MBJ6723864.1 hypothetical protein [Geomesophilobacter sediminis]